MGNKLIPRKVTVGTTPTLLTSTQKRTLLELFYTGSTPVSLTGAKPGVTFAGDAFPLPKDIIYKDDKSNDGIYGITASGTADVWVWETE